jgi:cytochrome c
MRFVPAGLLAILLVLPSTVALGQSSLSRGKAIATANCGSCHSVAVSGASPNRKAPPFRTLAARYPLESIEEALAEGIVVGHETSDMPMFEFEPDEISDLLRYIGSLNRRR